MYVNISTEVDLSSLAGRDVDENRTEGEIYRWDGAKWTWDFHRDNMSVTAVTAITDNNVWAVADSPADENTYHYGPSLPLHWNGSSWQVLPRPKAFATANFSALVAVSASDMWAVGSSTKGTAAIAHYAGGQ